MPLNEIEQHPYLNYYQDIPTRKKNTYRGIIIGAFPVYGCTDTIDDQYNIVEERFNESEVFMRFFYGSKKSRFWHYTSKALGEAEFSASDLNPQNCVNLLEKNNLLITDAIFRTNRLNYGSEDKNLMIDHLNFRKYLTLNKSLEEIIKNNPSVNSIYFTANNVEPKSPYGWFCKNFSDKLNVIDEYIICDRLWARKVSLEGRILNAFFLPTPKPRGVHFGDKSKNAAFSSYLKKLDPVFFNYINKINEASRTDGDKLKIKDYREEFIIENYRQALKYSNLHWSV